MRIALTLLALIAGLLAACTDPQKEEITKEEDYFLNAYAVFTSGQAYDEVCNDGKMANNPILNANLSMISTQMYAAFRNNHKGAPDTVIGEAVKASGDTMRKSQVKILKEKGCDDASLKPFSDALTYFTSVPAEVNYSQMMQDLKKLGIQHSAPAPMSTPANTEKQ